MAESVLRSESGGVLTLALNRPDKLNAFDAEMTAALLAALEDADRETVRCVVLSGVGRGFSSGQDLGEFVRLQQGEVKASVADHLRHGYNRVVLKLRTIEKPVIASLNGIAAGVGLSIALACDIRIAADDARLTLGFSKIGLIPDGGASMTLPALVGLGRALELAWTSDRVGAEEALRIGLVNRVVPAADLEARTAELASQLAAMPALALGLTKRAFNQSTLPHFAAWLDDEANYQELAAAGPDHREGVAAFIEKRAPAFGVVRT